MRVSLLEELVLEAFVRLLLERAIQPIKRLIADIQKFLLPIKRLSRRIKVGPALRLYALNAAACVFVNTTHRNGDPGKREAKCNCLLF